MNRAHCCTDGRARTCISGNSANYRTAECAFSCTPRSSAFRLGRRISSLSLCCLNVGGRRRLRRRHFWIDACLLLS